MSELEQLRARATAVEGWFHKLRIDLEKLRQDHGSLIQLVEAQASALGQRTSGAAPKGAARHNSQYEQSQNASYLEMLHGYRKRILESGLLDPDWYFAQNPDLSRTETDAAMHFLTYGSREGRRPGPLFNPTHYLSRNPDLINSDLNPLVHYLQYGAEEGRTAWNNQDVINWQAEFIAVPEMALAMTKRREGAASFLPRSGRVVILTSSLGNFFFHDLSGLLAIGLRAAGFDVVESDETLRDVRESDTIFLMAPHEFYFLGAGNQLRNDPRLATSIPINTEQWQTQWFSKSLPFCLRAPKMLDINLQSAASFVRLGRQCRYLALGHSDAATYSRVDSDVEQRPILKRKHAPLSRMSREILPLRDRPIDILFVGGVSARRGPLLAELAPFLSGKNVFLHLPSHAKPLTAEENVDAGLYTYLARNSKILLNLHQGAIQYFEWQRIVFNGFWQKSVVATEKCFGLPYFHPNVHYVECEARDLAARLQEVLSDISDGNAAQAMVDDASDVLRTEYALSKCISWI